MGCGDVGIKQCDCENENGDENAGSHLEPNSENSKMVVVDKCLKCKIEGHVAVVLRKTDGYCKPCFVQAVRHKYRSTVAKSRIFRQKCGLDRENGQEKDIQTENIILVFDMRMEQQSNVLCHLNLDEFHSSANLQTNEDVERREKILSKNQLKFQILIVPFPQSLNHGANDDFATSLVEKTKDRLTVRYPTTPIHVLHLTVNDCEFNGSLDCHRDQDDHDEATTQKFTNMTMNAILFGCGERLRCNKIFTPQISTDIAVELLNGISLAKDGSTLHNSTTTCKRLSPHTTSAQCQFDAQNTANIQLVRPLRHFNEEEVANYVSIHELQQSKVPNQCNDDPVIDEEAQIESLIKTFLTDLNKNFPSTIPTVFKTCDCISGSVNPKAYHSGLGAVEDNLMINESSDEMTRAGQAKVISQMLSVDSDFTIK